MRLRCLLLSGSLLVSLFGYGQKEKPAALMDTAVFDFDEIFSELDLLLNSLYTPRSFLAAQVSAGTGFFQYNTASGGTTETRQKLLISPVLGYYHKSGFGASAGASFLSGNGSRPWQSLVTGSYDYLQKRSFITGLSATRYFIQSDLPFYTSPLQNELNAYLTYRKTTLKPSVSASYGWGSRREVEQRTEIIEEIRKAKRNNGNGNTGRNGNGPGNGNGNNNGGGNGNNNSGGTTTTTTVDSYEKIIDFNLQLSVRHDFYFLKLFSKNDYLRLTPQLVFNSGSQQFGFNSVINSALTGKGKGRNAITTTKRFSLDDRLAFRPLSLTTQLRTEYAYGKFFVQPQVFLDYYFPAQSNHFTTTVLVNTGFIF